jgi:hypothetical protein
LETTEIQELRDKLFVAEKVMRSLFQRNKELEEQKSRSDDLAQTHVGDQQDN